MDRMMSRWFQCVIYHIVFRCFCRGLVTLAPRNVPWENEQWTLECSLDSIVSTVSINNPTSATVGTCDPTGVFPASCTPTAGYTFAINETSNIVSMTLTIGNSETGTWTCLHSTDSATYNLQSPLPSRHLSASLLSYEKHFMSVIAGSELTPDKVYNFSAHCGCMSATLKFVWTTVPGSSMEDISNTSSPSFTCTTKSAYMSTIDANAFILRSVTSRGTKLKVSVYVEGYYDLTSAEYTYDVTFSPSTENDGGSDKNSFWYIVLAVVVFPGGAVIYIFKKPKSKGSIPIVYVKKGCTIKWDAARTDKCGKTNPEWTKNGKKVQPITTSISGEKMLIDNASIQDEGLYVCTFNRKMMPLMYNIIIIDTVYNVKKGEDITLGADIEGSQMWTVNGKNEQCADEKLLISKASQENEGLYVCTVEWPKVPLKYYLIVEGSEETVYVEKGSDIEFGKSIVTTVSWSREKTFKGQQTLGSNILIQEASEKDDGIYYCTIESKVELKYNLNVVDSKKEDVEATDIKDREAAISSTSRTENSVDVRIQI